MGEIHSTGQRSNNVSEERDLQRRSHVISSSKGIRGTQRKQETQEWNSFLLQREKTKTHSFLTSSLRNTLNVLERLAHKLSWLPLLNTHREATGEAASAEGHHHPIVTAAGGLRDSVREARLLLEELSLISGKLSFNVIPSSLTGSTDDPNQLSCASKKEETAEDASSGSDLKQLKMHLQGNANLMVKSYPLTQTVVIVPINEWVEKREEINWRNDSGVSTRALRPNDERANDPPSLKGAHFGRESHTTTTTEGEIESRKLLVIESEEKTRKEVPRHQPSVRDERSSPSSATSSPSLLNAPSSIMKPDKTIYWGICETISEEDEEDLAEKSEEELEFEVSACSSPQSDLIFDSFQADDDDERLEQLIDLRDDPDYEALIQVDTRIDEDSPDFHAELNTENTSKEEVIMEMMTNEIESGSKESDVLINCEDRASHKISAECASQREEQFTDTRAKQIGKSATNAAGEDNGSSIPSKPFYISQCFQSFCDATSNDVIDAGMKCASGLTSEINAGAKHQRDTMQDGLIY